MGIILFLGIIEISQYVHYHYTGGDYTGGEGGRGRGEGRLGREPMPFGHMGGWPTHCWTCVLGILYLNFVFQSLKGFFRRVS